MGDYLGERCVVLMFFPFAYSSTCTAQMCGAVAENYSAWEALEAEVIGVSIDSPYTNQRFSADYEVPFPIASDFNKDVAAAYDAIFDELNGWRGVTRRVVYVIYPRSTTIANPSAPAAHTVISPSSTSRRLISLSRVVVSRAPVAPNGCPMAMDPPITLITSTSGCPTAALRPNSSSANCLDDNA